MKNLILSAHQQKTLAIIQQLKPYQRLKVRDIAKSNPEKFIELVKSLIDLGFIEYEFTDDYTALKRLNMSNFGIKELNELKQMFDKKSQLLDKKREQEKIKKSA